MDHEHGGRHMLKIGRIALVALVALLTFPAHAQQATVIAACGTPPATLLPGQVLLPFIDTGGHLCTTGGGAGNPGGSASQVQFNSGGTSFGGISGVTSNGTVMTAATNDFALAGATTGTTLLNASATASGTATLPANTGTIAELNLAQTFSAAQTIAQLIVTGSITSVVRSSAAATVTVSATTDYFLCLDPTANAIAVNLPASPATGLTYLVKDCTGQAAAHNITITPAAGNIDGAANKVLSTAFQSVGITYTGAQWSLN